MCILVAIMLCFVSALLYISLRSRQVYSARVLRVILELWIAFALILCIFAYISHFLGSASSGGSLAGELATRLAHWYALTQAQQFTLLAGALLAVGLFVHVLLSIQALQSRPLPELPAHEGENS